MVMPQADRVFLHGFDSLLRHFDKLLVQLFSQSLPRLDRKQPPANEGRSILGSLSGELPGKSSKGVGRRAPKVTVTREGDSARLLVTGLSSCSRKVKIWPCACAGTHETFRARARSVLADDTNHLTGGVRVLYATLANSMRKDTMPRNTLRASLLTSMICGVTAFAAEDAPTSPKSNADWTVDDVLSFERASDFRVSPDCRWALWVKSVPDKDKNEWVSHLFLSSLTGGKEVQLTRGGGGCSSPRWSPDSQLIAFLSSRPHPKDKPDDKEKTGVWLINPFGGEPWPLTDGERAVLALNWADTNNIIYTAQ